jgi:hypothetical protein
MQRPGVSDEFDGPELDPRWVRTCPGGGTLTLSDSTLRLALPQGAAAGRYSDAQIDDYTGLRLRQFLWRPPLRMEVRARASTALSASPIPGERASGTPAAADFPLPSRGRGSGGEVLRGTAGFGFWNYPLTLAGAAVRLPDAVWFFAASPPSNMELVPGMPGWGWKAQVVHAHRWGALVAGAPALAAILGARLTGRDQLAARWVGRVTGAREALLDVSLADWHDYALEWRPDLARFFVDGDEVLAAPDPPRGSLGFVAWIDNQYAVATPRGELRFGSLDADPEWLELDSLHIRSGR